MLGVGKPHEEETGVGSRRERPRIREIEILGNEQAPFGLGSSPNVGVVLPPKSFVEHRIGVEPEQGEARGHGRSDIFVELVLKRP